MRFRTCLSLCLLAWTVAIGGAGCSAPTAAPASLGADGGGGFPSVDAGIAGDAGVGAPDASVCVPASVSTFVPVYKPTPRYAGACTSGQLAAVIRDCFDPSTDSQAACDAWGNNLRNADCRSCWRGGPVDSASATKTWAPYVFVTNPGLTTYVNVSGCIVLAEPGELLCAQMIQNDFACDLGACEESCPVPITGSATGAVAALDACFDSADVGGCSTYAKEADTCRRTLARSSPAAFCFDAERGEPEALLQYFTLACGAAPPDSGDGSVDDAGIPPSEDGGGGEDAGVGEFDGSDEGGRGSGGDGASPD